MTFSLFKHHINEHNHLKFLTGKNADIICHQEHFHIALYPRVRAVSVLTSVKINS